MKLIWNLKHIVLKRFYKFINFTITCNFKHWLLHMLTSCHLWLIEFNHVNLIIIFTNVSSIFSCALWHIIVWTLSYKMQWKHFNLNIHVGVT
jgi:hypothetical protein